MVVGWVPREQMMLKGHLPRVMNHHVYWYTKMHCSRTVPCPIESGLHTTGVPRSEPPPPSPRTTIWPWAYATAGSYGGTLHLVMSEVNYGPRIFVMSEVPQ